MPIHDLAILGPLVLVGLGGLSLMVTGAVLVYQQQNDQRAADNAEKAAIRQYKAAAKVRR